MPKCTIIINVVENEDNVIAVVPSHASVSISLKSPLSNSFKK
jgi:hypothetical protein